MDKRIGFRRNIYLSWLDATAALCAETSDLHVLRARLDPIVAEQVQSHENRQVAITILLNIWVKTGERYPQLRNEAVTHFAHSNAAHERIWLHYGLSLLAYDFFRLGMVTMGQLLRYHDAITPHAVEERIAAVIGQLGALEKATARLFFSLRNWGILSEGERRHTYRAQPLAVATPAIEQWMLAAALAAHPAQEIPFADLIRLPELFPCRFTLSVDDLRRNERFEVQRQGMGWDMVRLLHSRELG